ncbi:ADP-heptose--LPS heptosyltransferase [Photobacterium jeanii]|uniref:Lipopolysaccharide heptosyltransferase 1 n=1 Tax=Photobacterium jeanii TaxID=858640 RepID=A0A178KIB8_9GAMM|nr:lipopolysaccharide heptosyltransferase RfaC [Photobacterium jeanii]OAN17009.1 ADP-heptose--LPS heptosyltransferase [Photobacterium jeanii]PST88299.1 lipopolysaccharide heptosyltransferase RfaC [Photobacterium jeanii]
MRVLIVKTTSMGDVIHTLPAITDAVRAIPSIQFDWVVEEGFAQIPAWHNAVEQVIPVAIRRWRKNIINTIKSGEWQRCKQQIQAQQYDAVIDAQGLIKSAFLTCKAHGEKHGYDKHSIKEPLASYCYDKRHPVSKELHAVERIRQLFASALGYTLPTHTDGQVQTGDYAIAQHFLAQATPTKQPYLVFLHATTRDNKHWPEQHWRDLIAQVSTLGYQVKLPWGAPHEQQRALRLAEGFDHVEVLPKLSLYQVAEVLANANAVVSVDTGLSHLAAALDKPNITLYGPTDPGLIGGYGQGQVYLTASSLNQQDMAALTAEHVFAQLSQLLQQGDS